MNFLRISLKKKIIGTFTLVVLMSLGTLASFSFIYTKSIIKNTVIENHKISIEQKSHSLNSKIESIKSDLRFISSLSSVSGIFRAMDSDGIDKATGSTFNQWIARFNQASSSLLKERSNFNEVSIFDNDGIEISRVIKRQDNTLEVVDTDDLLEDVEEKYYTKTMTLKKNEFFIDRLKLEIDEEEKIIRPYRSFIYITTPIFNINNKINGVIAVKSYSNNLLNNIYNGIEEGGEYLVTNDIDDLIIYKDKQQLYASLIKKRKMKKFKSVVLDDGKLTPLDKALTSDKNGGIYLKEKIYLSDDKKHSWNIVVKISETFIASKLKGFIKIFVIVFGASMILVTLIALFISSRLVNTFSKISKNLATESSNISEVSYVIGKNSDIITNTAISQAEAIEETSSSLTQITNMNKSNLESVGKTKESASSNREVAQQGEEIATGMNVIMSDVDESFKHLKEQVENNNKDMEEITKIIKEIANKTKVINDIVFQTKLLSFNASVEAARAGEHGRGFSIVAEEVGNLATMSGNASNEISTLISQSVDKVQQVVESSTKKLNHYINAGEKKVQDGLDVSQKCGSILNQIVQSSKEIELNISQVSNYIKEESEGVENISVAMSSLEELTNENTTVANLGKDNANKLLKQSEVFHSIINILEKEVYGSATDNTLEEINDNNILPNENSTITEASNIVNDKEIDKVS